MKVHVLALLIIAVSLGSCNKKQPPATPAPTPAKPEALTPLNVPFRIFQLLAHDPVNVSFSPVILKNITALLSSDLIEAKKTKLNQIMGAPVETTKSNFYSFENAIKSDSKNKASLTGSLIFKGHFSQPFKKEESLLTHFQSSPHASNTIKVMHRTGNYPYFENETSQWIELKFQNSSISLWLALPKKGVDVHQMEEKLNAEVISAVEKGLKESKIEIVVPKLNLEQALSIKEIMALVGLDFAYNKTSFNKNSKLSKFNFSEISQIANLNLNEDGINESGKSESPPAKEASSFSLKPKTFYATQPFIFILKNSNPNEILLLGRVYKP